jgi:hypothetical protein
MKTKFYTLFAVFCFLIQMNTYTQDGYILVVGSSTDDQTVLDILINEGYSVARGLTYSGELSAEKLDSVNGADLVIFSRNGSTAGHGEAEPVMQQWADVFAPILSLSPWIMRNNRWRWINSDVLSCAGSDSISIPEDAQNHAIYNGVDVSSGFLEVLEPNRTRNEKFAREDGGGNSVDAGMGTLLALDPSDEGIMAAEWKEGDMFYEGGSIAAPFASSDRMWLGFVTEGDNCKVEPNVMSAFNGNDDAKTIFLNAVAYMMGAAPGSVSYSVNNTLRIFPNPASNQITIQGLNQLTAYEIVDLTGSIVLRGYTKNGIDISHLNAGVYILRTEDALTVKFIKQ